MSNIIRRTLHPEIKVLDAKSGLCEYIASDESIDCYREIIRADGWRFTSFEKNAPFVDSHDYSTVKNLLGRVVDFRVQGRQLIETVQWAVDVAENTLAQLGWRMAQAGYLRAVSVGFKPVASVDRWAPERRAEWLAQLQDLGVKDENQVHCIYTAQEQLELSAVVIGANPNALALAYKSGCIGDADLHLFSQKWTERETVRAADGTDAAAQAIRQAREEFLVKFDQLVRSV